MRRKYTSTHRRKAPTGDPECPPDVREANLVKLAIGNKVELATCGEIYNMEVESYEPEESDGVMTRVRYIPAQTQTCRYRRATGDCAFGRAHPINQI